MKKDFFFTFSAAGVADGRERHGRIGAKPQGWSYDPVVDHLKALQTNIMKFEEYSAYCQTNPYETECDGINDHIPTQFMKSLGRSLRFASGGAGADAQTHPK